MGKGEDAGIQQPARRPIWRKVRIILASLALGGLSLAVFITALTQTLTTQLHALDVQPDHVELDASSSREVALLTLRGVASGWTRPHGLSLTEDSHCDVFANKDDASVASLQFMGLQEDGERVTIQMAVAHGSKEEVQARVKRAGDFLLKCQLHFDVNVFNTGFYFKMEQRLEKGSKIVGEEDAPAPVVAETHEANAEGARAPAPRAPRFDLVRKTWELSKPSLPDFKTLAEAAYFAEFDIPHGQLEGVTQFFDRVAVRIKVDVEYFVERSPTAEVGIVVDGPVIARRGNTSTVISIPARVNMKVDAEAVNNLASAVATGRLENGVRKSPEGRTLPCSKLVLLSKAPRSAMARLSGPSHEFDLVSEGPATRQDVLDAGRRLLPRRLGPVDGNMPKDDRGLELTTRLFMDDTVLVRIDINTTKETKFSFALQQPGKSVTNVVQAHAKSMSDHTSIGVYTFDSQMTPDQGPMWSMDTPVLTFSTEVTDSKAHVLFQEESSSNALGGSASVELDATWQDLLDMLSDWFHADKTTLNQGSQRLLESPPVASKPYVVTVNTSVHLKWEPSMYEVAYPHQNQWGYYRAYHLTNTRESLDLSWVQNFSRDWKSFDSIELEVTTGVDTNFNSYVLGQLYHLRDSAHNGTVAIPDGAYDGPLVHGNFKFSSALEWDYSSADVLKVSGHTDMLASCPTNPAGLDVMKNLSSLFSDPAAPTAMDDAKCGMCQMFSSYWGPNGPSTISYTANPHTRWEEDYATGRYSMRMALSCPNPYLHMGQYNQYTGWEPVMQSCCEARGRGVVSSAMKHFSLTVGESKNHSFSLEIPMSGKYERTEGQSTWGLFEVGNSGSSSSERTDMTGSITVFLDNVMDMMENGVGSMTMPKLQDPWRQDSTVRYLLNHTLDFMGYQLVVLDMLDAMGATVVLDESHLKTSESWVSNVMTRTIELTVSDLQVFFQKTNYSADDRHVVVNARFKGESRFEATMVQSRDVPAKKTTVRYNQVTRDGSDMTNVVAEANVSDLPMDMKYWEASLTDVKTNEQKVGLHAYTGHGFANASASVNRDHIGDLAATWTDGEVPNLNNLTVSIMDKDLKTLSFVVDSDSQTDITKFGVNFSDSLLTKHDGTFSLHSMENYLTVYGAIADRESTASYEAAKKSFDFAFSKVGLLSFHFKLKDGLSERLMTQIVESAVGDQKVFDLMHADDMLTNTNSTGRFTTGGPSALDATLALSYTTTTTTTYCYSWECWYYGTTTTNPYKTNGTNTTWQVADTTAAEPSGQLMTTELKFLVVEAKGGEPGMLSFNVTEESIQTFGMWVSGKEADGDVMGTFGLMTANKQDYSSGQTIVSRLEAGSGNLHVDFGVTGKDGTDQKFRCNASEITGGFDSMVLFTDKGMEKFKLGFMFGDSRKGATDSTDKKLHWELGTDKKKMRVDFMKDKGQLMTEVISEDIVDGIYWMPRPELTLQFNAKEVDGGFESRLSYEFTPTTTTTSTWYCYYCNPYPYPYSTSTSWEAAPIYGNGTWGDNKTNSTNMTNSTYSVPPVENNTMNSTYPNNTMNSTYPNSTNSTMTNSTNSTNSTARLLSHETPTPTPTENNMSFVVEFNVSTANIGFLFESSKTSDVHLMVSRNTPKSLLFSVPQDSIWVNFTETSTDFLTGSASLKDLGYLSGSMYHGHHTALMLESTDTSGMFNFNLTTFLSGVEDAFQLANVKFYRKDAAKHDTLGVSWYSPNSSSTSSSRLLAGSSTTWTNWFPPSVAMDFSQAESMVYSEAPLWKASVPADFSGVRLGTSGAIENINFMGNLTWEEGAGIMLSAMAYDQNMLKLNLSVDMLLPRTSTSTVTTTTVTTTTMTTTITTTKTTTTQVANAGTTTEGTVAPTPAPPPPPPPPIVVVNIELKMEDVSEFNQTAMEASLNKELTKGGEKAEIKIVQVDYTVKVEYTFAATVSEAQIKQALANLHGVSISQISITMKRRLTEDANFRRLTSSAVEASILTSDPAKATSVKAAATDTSSLATELTTISGQEVTAPTVSAAPATAVEVVTEIISTEPVSSDGSGGTPAPPVLTQSAMSQIVTNAAQDSGLNAQITVEEPMIVTQTATSTTTTATTTTGGGDTTTTTLRAVPPDSHCSQVKFGLTIAVLLLSWAV